MQYQGKEYKRKYTKAIAISPDDMKFIERVKGKKSKAGKLDEIIQFYKTNKQL